MTNDQPEQPAVTGNVQWVDLGAIRFGVPGVPYSVWPMAKSDDFIAEFTKAKEWADAYREVFESYAADQTPAPPPATAHRDAQGQRVNANPPPTSAPPPQQPPAGQGGAQKGTGRFCPDHQSVEVILSKAEYQTYDDVDGEQVPAKFFCPAGKNGTDKNHLVWRSKTVAAPTADGIPMPVEPSAEPF